MAFLRDSGAVAFTDGVRVVADNKLLGRCMTYARGLGALIVGHPQDPALSKGAVATKGKFASLYGLPAVTPLAERMGLERDLALVEATGADGVELNFGCPHGMSERGMGSAVGQVPEYIEMVARWCKAHTRMPVIVKLTPNITDIRYPARAAYRGGADAVSLINTVSSITAVNLDTFSPEPSIDGKGSHGGYCGPAVKPIALNMVAEIARDPATRGMPISGIGGITTWRDAAEFLALGAGNVQVCTAAMTPSASIRRMRR